MAKKDKERYSVGKKAIAREQRRVYKSEVMISRRIWGGRPKKVTQFVGPAWSLATCQNFVDMVTENRRTMRRYGEKSNIKVVSGAYHDTARASYCNKKGREVSWEKTGAVATIRLPLWARNDFIILHEISHHLHSEDADFVGDKWRHDGEFASIYLDLLREFGSEEDYLELRAEYVKNKVEFKIL